LASALCPPVTWSAGSPTHPPGSHLKRCVALEAVPIPQHRSSAPPPRRGLRLPAERGRFLLAPLLYVLTDAPPAPLPVPLEERMDCWPWVASVHPL
jgi:hypothetical protein